MWLANSIGRRMSLIVASILVFIGDALQAGASGYIAPLYVGRFIAGVTIGIASSLTLSMFQRMRREVFVGYLQDSIN